MSNQQLRHEIKFAAYSLELDRIYHWLKLHTAGFFEPYPVRRVNSVYFDDWDYQAFCNNLAGISRRTKVRYRWYGQSALPIDGALEVKQKRNQLGWKERYAVADLKPVARWSRFIADLDSKLPMDARHWLQFNPQPVIMNSYTRRYFETADRTIRATIDTEQVAYDQRAADVPNTRREAIAEDRIVVEFKFAPESWSDASKLIDSFPLRIGRHSKYMNAVRSAALL